MSDDDQAAALRQAGREKSMLVVGVVRVVDRGRQRIAENSCRFIERNTVPENVLPRLFGIPFALHKGNLACLAGWRLVSIFRPHCTAPMLDRTLNPD
jgi:hypothetical protein